MDRIKIDHSLKILDSLLPKLEKNEKSLKYNIY